jgi:hypothetical protein
MCVVGLSRSSPRYGARARFERLGIVDVDGKLVSQELPPDMLPDSDTTLGTG